MSTWREQINQNIVEPSAIHGLPNGQLPDHVLVDVYDGNGRRIGRLCAVAARSWAAMVAAAKADGVILDATDTYRPLEIQQKIFRERYRETDQGNGSRVCGGKRWFQLPHTATAACPGTSNHGRGLAVDNRFHGDGLKWLERRAHEFGWAWEVPSEDWHIHYMPGDRIPQPVLDYEAHSGTPVPTNQEDHMTLIEVTAGPDKGKVFYVVGNVAREQTQASAKHLVDGGVRYVKLDDEAWAQTKAACKV